MNQGDSLGPGVSDQPKQLHPDPISKKGSVSVQWVQFDNLAYIAVALYFTAEDLQAISPAVTAEKRTREEDDRKQMRNSCRSESTVPSSLQMAEVKSMFREVLPKQGQLSVEDVTTMVLCKPKLLPLKSLTLEKLEKMQQTAQDTVRQQEMAEKDNRQIIH